MTQHPALPAPSDPSREGTGAPPPRPATVRAAAVLTGVLAALLGLLAVLVFVSGTDGALTGAPGGGAPEVGVLVGAALVAGLPLALAALHGWMALAVRAGRTWPVPVTTVLASLVGTALVLGAPGELRRAGQGGDLLLTVALLAQVVLVLGLQVATVVLLRRPSARAWAQGRARLTAA